MQPKKCQNYWKIKSRFLKQISTLEKTKKFKNGSHRLKISLLPPRDRRWMKPFNQSKSCTVRARQTTAVHSLKEGELLGKVNCSFERDSGWNAYRFIEEFYWFYCHLLLWQCPTTYMCKFWAWLRRHLLTNIFTSHSEW